MLLRSQSVQTLSVSCALNVCRVICCQHCVHVITGHTHAFMLSHSGTQLDQTIPHAELATHFAL